MGPREARAGVRDLRRAPSDCRRPPRGNAGGGWSHFEAIDRSSRPRAPRESPVRLLRCRQCNDDLRSRLRPMGSNASEGGCTVRARSSRDVSSTGRATMTGNEAEVIERLIVEAAKRGAVDQQLGRAVKAAEDAAAIMAADKIVIRKLTEQVEGM